ncbi:MULTISPECIES: transcriptional regulator [unclassified Mesorhizobium]|uniref:transcriptional regulator n=1 Tax=unclassified Mesorhizobium TaxID=325217 RepID=UPI001093FF47|nr:MULTISPECIES: transcriptional regulator [unclassified Mesorhizobium]TGT91726.1 transcriptional regulator [Mesorhizobium sp. M8A.F.Ca.ET.161.01.1.1]TGV44752.1 transcriptional regulator [Mesorhizobium sp. M8A.F.Ca.ET.142.01.1.1]
MPWVRVPNEEVLETNPHLKEFLPLLDTHNAESPRGAVMVACSYLDEQLRGIIDAYLVEDSDKAVLLDGFNAPLGTFSARIKAAHCLSLISDVERDDFDTLRKIRNEFAHSHRVSFEDRRVVDLCNNLQHSAKPYGKVEVNSFGLFSSAAVGLALGLINRAHYAAVERLKKREWRR